MFRVRVRVTAPLRVALNFSGVYSGYQALLPVVFVVVPVGVVMTNKASSRRQDPLGHV